VAAGARERYPRRDHTRVPRPAISGTNCFRLKNVFSSSRICRYDPYKYGQHTCNAHTPARAPGTPRTDAPSRPRHTYLCAGAFQTVEVVE